MDQLDLKAKKANQVYKAHPDREVSLVPKDPKEALAIQAFLDRMVRLVSKDQRENQAKMVWTAKRAKRVFQEKPVLRQNGFARLTGQAWTGRSCRCSRQHWPTW